MTDNGSGGIQIKIKKELVPSVVRTQVSQLDSYKDYKENLREDFIYCCAYCGISETEAGGVRFTIDHYEPRSARRDLENNYTNLMWCCDQCNIRKGDLHPPVEARSAGNRFFRPDEDLFSDHFELSEKRLLSTSNVGEFNIEQLDLNRRALQVIRDLRRRLSECQEHVAEGIRGLQGVRIDQLPPDVRGKALTMIRNFTDARMKVEDAVDHVLADTARSALLDDDPEAGKRAEARAVALRERQAMYPGIWRGRKTR